MPNDSPRPDVAVFIDFENVYVSVRDKLDANPNFEMIMDRVEDFGRVVIARAYADWYRYPRVTSALYANNIEPMYVPTYYYDRDMGRTGRAIKNSVDMNLCIDAMKTLFTNTNIAKFVLATGDRDFIPLVNTIRQHGKDVIVIGIGGAASAHLAQSADEFIFYEQLIGKKPIALDQDIPRAKMPEKGREYEYIEADESTPLRSREREHNRERDRDAVREPQRAEVTRSDAPRVEPPREAIRSDALAEQDVYDTLVNAINLARERGYVCSFGSLKLLMKELMGGDFRETKYKDTSGRPFAKFKDFVLEAERRGKVQVFTRGTVNEVFLPGEDPYKLSQFAGDIKEEAGAPVIEIAEPAPRSEVRSAVTSTGRRRRRRARGPQRADGLSQDSSSQLGDVDDLDDDDGADLILENLALSDLTEPIDSEDLAELYALDAGTALDADQFTDEDRSAAIFEELRDRVEEQAAETESIAILAPVEALAEATGPDDSLASNESVPATSFLPFAEAEWTLLRLVMSRFERPVSFAQIHDVLREERNNAGIARTNEELRSLAKQAINTGVLERIGKGNRASYRLAQSATEAPDQAEQMTAAVAETPSEVVSEPETTTPVEAVLEAEVVPTVETEELAPVELASDVDALALVETEVVSPSVVEITPAEEVVVVIASEQEPASTGEAAAEVVETVAEPTPAAEVIAAPVKRPRARRKTADAEAVEASPVAEPAKPKRSPRKKAAESAPVAVEAVAEEPVKPKRTRKKKSDIAES